MLTRYATSVAVVIFLGLSFTLAGDDLFQKGFDALNKKDYDLAISSFTRVIRGEPTKVDAYFNRALAYAGKRDFDKAIADYTMVVKLNPKDDGAFYNRGLAH